MFIVNPDSALVPSFRVCPFKTDNISINTELPDDDFEFNYFNTKFGTANWEYTYNGREAIHFALETYNLEQNDLVTILTTSENYYISSCVTKTIESFCRWNRELTSETKIIFVNHEFGYPYPEMEKLIATSLPIIEDCCTTFFSQDKRGLIGKYGDFAIYSFPKFFPIQIGGIIVSNKGIHLKSTSILKKEQKRNIKNVLSYQLRNSSKLLNKRKENFEYALTQLTRLGFSERFEKNEAIVPSMMLLNNNSIIKDLNAFKFYLSNNGIQNSVFYGEDAFFIPNHQNLNTIEIDFIIDVISHYIINKNL